MNYLSFFQNEDRLDGGDFRCMLYRSGGEVSLSGESSYPMIFVLRGRLELNFHYHKTTVEAGQLIVIERTALCGCICSEQTVLLEYASPDRLSNYFARSAKVFDAPCSSAIPILPPLQVWVESLLEHQLAGNLSVESAHSYRKSLAGILVGYPRRELNELFAPFFACASGSCEECMSERCRVPEEASK